MTVSLHFRCSSIQLQAAADDSDQWRRRRNCVYLHCAAAIFHFRCQRCGPISRELFLHLGQPIRCRVTRSPNNSRAIFIHTTTFIVCCYATAGYQGSTNNRACPGVFIHAATTGNQWPWPSGAGCSRRQCSGVFLHRGGNETSVSGANQCIAECTQCNECSVQPAEQRVHQCCVNCW